MTRFDRRRRARLADPDGLSGYEEADAELRLLAALDDARRAMGVTQAELAGRLGRSQPAVSQFFAGDYSASVEAVVAYMEALHIHADVRLRPARAGEPTLSVDSEELAEAAG